MRVCRGRAAARLRAAQQKHERCSEHERHQNQQKAVPIGLRNRLCADLPGQDAIRSRLCIGQGIPFRDQQRNDGLKTLFQYGIAGVEILRQIRVMELGHVVDVCTQNRDTERAAQLPDQVDESRPLRDLRPG